MTASPVTPLSLAHQKADGQPLVMVTAYDYPSAQLADAAGVDLVLVGDSAANVVLGYDSTIPVTVDELVMLTKAVRRGLRHAMLIADLPFGSYEASDLDAVRVAQRFVKEGGAAAVKLERGGTSTDRARAIVAAGIPVIGHVGLTPQAATTLGGYRAQGRTADAAEALIADAVALQQAGCFAIVVEAVPAAVTELLVARLDCLSIGIGAGAATDGQVLVWHDLLGITDGRLPKFVQRFAEVRTEIERGLDGYLQAVRTRAFPAAEHTYGIDEDELRELRSRLAITAQPQPDQPQ